MQWLRKIPQALYDLIAGKRKRKADIAAFDSSAANPTAAGHHTGVFSELQTLRRPEQDSQLWVRWDAMQFSSTPVYMRVGHTRVPTGTFADG